MGGPINNPECLRGKGLAFPASRHFLEVQMHRRCNGLAPYRTAQLACRAILMKPERDALRVKPFAAVGGMSQ
jgi:hypothetical protein